MYYILNSNGEPLYSQNHKPDEGVLFTEKDYAHLVAPIKLKFDFDLDEWIDSATPEEIAELNKVEVPQTISLMKFKMQLILMGMDIEILKDKISKIPYYLLPEINKKLIFVKLDNATFIERYSIELQTLAQLIQWSDAQLDELFINGNKLN